MGKTCAKRGLSSDAMELKRFWIVIALDQSKSPFSNLFPRGVKSEIVGFSKIDVSLDFLPTGQAGLGTFLIKPVCRTGRQKGARKDMK